MVILKTILWMMGAFLLFLTVLLVLILSLIKYSVFRSVRIASRTACPHCGTRLGRRAVMDAKKTFVKNLRRKMTEEPNAKLRIITKWEVRCVRCERVAFFSPGTNQLVAE